MAMRAMHGFHEAANRHLIARLVAGVARCSNGKRRGGLLEDAKNQQPDLKKTSEQGQYFSVLRLVRSR